MRRRNEIIMEYGTYMLAFPSPFISDTEPDVNQEKTQPRHIVPVTLEPAEPQTGYSLSPHPCKRKNRPKLRYISYFLCCLFYNGNMHHKTW